MRSLLPVSVFAAVLVYVGSLGCTGAMFNDRDRLKSAVEEFNEGLRWGKVDGCAAHLPLAQRAPFAERFASIQDEFEVMDYEVQRVQWDRSKSTADVRVVLSWSLKRRGLVERSVLAEHWIEIRGGWMMTKEVNISGSLLPLLDQPTPEEIAAALAPPPEPKAAAATTTTTAPAH